MSLIEIENLSFKYKEAENYALKDINIKVERGEYIAIIGHNGSGKSTLARLLNGLLTPETGKIVIDELSTADKNNLYTIRGKVGVVFQNPDNQLVASIVEDDVAFGPENLGVPRKEIGERIEFALKAVDMSEYRKASPTRLSGGQKQRIAIAGVLAIKPEIIILDESTAMLDPKGRAEVMDVIRRLNKENGMTVILITHYMEEVIEADRVIVLSNGNIAMDGTPTEIFSRSTELKKLELDVPEATYIATELSKRGLKINTEIFTKEALAEELCKLLQKN